MAKIYLRNKGGIGNQLFMYSFAKSVAIDTGSRLYIDNATGFARDPYKRNPSLHLVLKHNDRVANRCFQIFFKICRLIPNKLLRTLGIYFILEKDIHELVHINSHELSKGWFVFIEGYFQSYRYFAKHKDEIFPAATLFRQISITTPYKQYSEEILKCNSVTVHVRRVQYDHELNATYYMNAFAELKKKVADVTFFVFSDDLQWCRDNFSGGDIRFVSVVNPDEIQELYLMTQCKHHIIANSSFSWWGAWLSENKYKVVIAPKATQIGVKDDFYPADWVVI